LVATANFWLLQPIVGCVKLIRNVSIEFRLAYATKNWLLQSIKNAIFNYLICCNNQSFHSVYKCLKCTFMFKSARISINAIFSNVKLKSGIVKPT